MMTILTTYYLVLVLQAYPQTSTDPWRELPRRMTTCRTPSTAWRQSMATWPSSESALWSSTGLTRRCSMKSGTRVSFRKIDGSFGFRLDCSFVFFLFFFFSQHYWFFFLNYYYTILRIKKKSLWPYNNPCCTPQRFLSKLTSMPK